MNNLPDLLSDAYSAVCEWQQSVMYEHDERHHLTIDECKAEMNLKLKQLKEFLNTRQDL
jgi:hypothetical protein